MFTSVVNLGFQTNGIPARAITVEGFGKVGRIDICKLLERWISQMFGMHKFTLIKITNGTSYCIDPTINSILGYKL